MNGKRRMHVKWCLKGRDKFRSTCLFDSTQLPIHSITFLHIYVNVFKTYVSVVYVKLTSTTIGILFSTNPKLVYLSFFLKVLSSRTFPGLRRSIHRPCIDQAATPLQQSALENRHLDIHTSSSTNWYRHYGGGRDKSGVGKTTTCRFLAKETSQSQILLFGSHTR